MRHLVLVVGVAAGVVFASAASMTACGSDDTSTFDADASATAEGSPAADPFLVGLTSIDIAPHDAVVEATPTKAGTQAYTVTGHFAGAPDKDVTSHVTIFSVENPAVGGFSGATFTTTTAQGGKTKVTATAASLSASTSVTVHFTASTTVPNAASPLPANPAASFTGTPDASRAPKLAYPADGTMFPPNLALLHVQWVPGSASNTLFEIAFESATTDVKVYARCEKPTAGPQPIQNGCVLALPASMYPIVAESNRAGDPVAITVRGSDDAGGGFGASAVASVQFAETDVQGGLYYWTTTAHAIMRFDFGNPQKAPESFLAPADVTDPSPKNGGSCVGCHAISRDGTKLVSSLDGEGAGWQIWIADLNAARTGKIAGDTADALQFASFDPTGDRFVAVADGNDDATRNTLFVHDGTTGARIAAESILEPNLVDHPDWSPDGNSIAYTHPTSLATNFKQTPYESGIDVITKSGTTWGAARSLVAAQPGKNRFNPSFAPDSSFLVFTESTCQNGTTNDDSCDGDADPAARTWAVLAAGGAPFELAHANAPGPFDAGPETSDTFPRFAPFVAKQGAGNLLWVTVASARDAGLLVPPGSGTRHGRWLWMFAIDPAKIAAHQDGSYAAFYLPFQDLTTSNHIGQWTTKVVGTAPVR